MPKDDAAPPAGPALPDPSATQAPALALATPANVAPASWLQDEYAGLGGDYVIDPATGKRRPA